MVCHMFVGMETDSSDSESYAGSAQSIKASQESVESKFVELVNHAFDPIPLDRPIATEMQHSGLLNAYTQDLLRLKATVDERATIKTEQIVKMKSLIKKIDANIDWLHTRVGSLESKVKRAVPIEYAKAESKIVYRDDHDM